MSVGRCSIPTPRDPGLVAIALAPLVFGALALSFGQDCNWDLRNYHYYNVVAWFSGRYATDYAPGYMCSYYNPTLFVPRVLAMHILSPIALAAATGAVQGCAAWPVYWFGVRLLPLAPRTASLVAAALAYVGASGGISASELGTSYIDSTAAGVALTGVGLCVLADWHDAARGAELERSCALGAFLLGAITGLRLQSVLYLFGAFASLAFARHATERRRWRALSLLVAGTVAGFSVALLPWALTLWRHFGNPMFPYFNGWFRSPYASLVNPYAPSLQPPTSLGEWLLLPFLVLADPMRGAEAPFFDLRMPVLYATALLACLGWRLDWPWYGGERLSRALGAFAAAYVPFLLRFTNYRFGVGFELMAPVLTVSIVLAMVRSGRLVAATLSALFAVVLGTTRRAEWGHAPFGPNHFGTSELGLPGDALLVTAGQPPSAFLVESLPRSVSMLRINADGDPLHSPDIHASVQEPNPFEPRLRARIRSHPGPLFLVTGDRRAAELALERYRLSISEPCRLIPSHVDLGYPLSLCRLRLLAEGAAPDRDEVRAP